MDINTQRDGFNIIKLKQLNFLLSKLLCLLRMILINNNEKNGIKIILNYMKEKPISFSDIIKYTL